MDGYVIALAGRIGSGKSTFADLLSMRFNISQVSFGNYVRSVAAQDGIAQTRENLQTLGQQLVDSNAREFCERVLEFVEWSPGQSLVIDGVRHVSILNILKELVSPQRLILIYVDVDNKTREQQVSHRDNASNVDLSRFDNDRTELETDELYANADIIVNGATEQNVDHIQSILVD